MCGVRLERNGPVLFVDANGLDLAAGQLVVIDRGGEEALASVVFGPGQLLANEPRVGPQGKVKRLATDEDVSRLGPRTTGDTGVLAAGLPESWAEWLAGPDDEPAVRVALDADAPSAGAFIERLFPGR